MLTLLNEPRLLPLPGFVLRDGTFVCGRSSKSELFVPDSTVSRQHAELHVAGTRVKVVDLNSSNGTFIDGERIGSAELRPSQVLSLGRVSFVLVEGDRLDDWDSSSEAVSTKRAAAPQPAEVDLLQLSEAQRRVLDHGTHRAGRKADRPATQHQPPHRPQPSAGHLSDSRRALPRRIARTVLGKEEWLVASGPSSVVSGKKRGNYRAAMGV